MSEQPDIEWALELARGLAAEHHRLCLSRQGAACDCYAGWKHEYVLSRALLALESERAELARQLDDPGRHGGLIETERQEWRDKVAELAREVERLTDVQRGTALAEQRVKELKAALREIQGAQAGGNAMKAWGIARAALCREAGESALAGESSKTPRDSSEPTEGDNAREPKASE